MAETSSVARPWARAVFETAQSSGTFQQWSDLLGQLADIVTDETMQLAIGHPRVTPDQLADIVNDVVGDVLDDAGKNFVRLLATYRRLSAVPDIADAYRAMRAEAENRIEVEVISAATLDASQQANIAAALKKRLGKNVDLSCSVDAGLLGGAVIRAGDMVIDDSMRGKLERLAARITH
ncbi:MAG: F0F1 ATP synthase subunit delta [Gammaproteobacteria bacterium]